MKQLVTVLYLPEMHRPEIGLQNFTSDFIPPSMSLDNDTPKVPENTPTFVQPIDRCFISLHIDERPAFLIGSLPGTRMAALS